MVISTYRCDTHNAERGRYHAQSEHEESKPFVAVPDSVDA